MSRSAEALYSVSLWGGRLRRRLVECVRGDGVAAGAPVASIHGSRRPRGYTPATGLLDCAAAPPRGWFATAIPRRFSPRPRAPLPDVARPAARALLRLRGFRRRGLRGLRECRLGGRTRRIPAGLCCAPLRPPSPACVRAFGTRADLPIRHPRSAPPLAISPCAAVRVRSCRPIGAYDSERPSLGHHPLVATAVAEHRREGEKAIEEGVSGKGTTGGDSPKGVRADGRCAAPSVCRTPSGAAPRRPRIPKHFLTALRVRGKIPP